MIGKVGTVVFEAEATRLYGRLTFLSPSSCDENGYAPAESVSIYLWKPEDFEAFADQIKTFADVYRTEKATKSPA